MGASILREHILQLSDLQLLPIFPLDLCGSHLSRQTLRANPITRLVRSHRYFPSSSQVILHSYAIPKKKDPEAHFRQAKERGAKEDTGIVNDRPVQKSLQNATKSHHKRQLSLWDQYVVLSNFRKLLDSLLK